MWSWAIHGCNAHFFGALGLNTARSSRGSLTIHPTQSRSVLGSLPALRAGGPRPPSPGWQTRVGPYPIPLAAERGSRGPCTVPGERARGRPGPARPLAARPRMAERHSDHPHRLTSPRPAPPSHWLSPPEPAFRAWERLGPQERRRQRRAASHLWPHAAGGPSRPDPVPGQPSPPRSSGALSSLSGDVEGPGVSGRGSSGPGTGRRPAQGL